MCKKIHRGGNAEQYNADKKYKEAVAVAVEACRGRHEGQKCYICLEAVHPHTGEGLVRGCGCGDRDGVSSPELGVAHVSCLARQAKILCEEAEANNEYGTELFDGSWKRWYTCSLCEQAYHGVVYCALGWACWKSCVGRPEKDQLRLAAMRQLGNGLGAADRHEEGLAVKEAELAAHQRLFPFDIGNLLTAKGNIANTLDSLGRHDEALAMRRDVFQQRKQIIGMEDDDTLREGVNLAAGLIQLGRIADARSFLSENKCVAVAKRCLGPDHDLTLKLRLCESGAVAHDDTASLDELKQAVATMEDVCKRARRVLGSEHPLTDVYQRKRDSVRDAYLSRLRQERV
jgi:hypothetical protein